MEKLINHIPFRKIIILVGIALIMAGFSFLNVDPDADSAFAVNHAFTGIGLLVAGAATSLAAILVG
jgi:hypothetical protein